MPFVFKKLNYEKKALLLWLCELYDLMIWLVTNSPWIASSLILFCTQISFLSSEKKRQSLKRNKKVHETFPGRMGEWKKSLKNNKKTTDKNNNNNKNTRRSSSLAASLNGHPLEAERYIFSLKRSPRLGVSSLDSHPRPDSTQRKERCVGKEGIRSCSHCGLQSLHLPMKITANISVNKKSLFACLPRNFPTKKLNVKWVFWVSIPIWQLEADTRERTILSHPLFPPPPVLVRWRNSYLELDRM